MSTPKELRDLANLFKYRIIFDGRIDEEAWPNRFKSTFHAITNLGDKKFNTYAKNPQEIGDQLWKREIKEGALELIQRAKRCTGQNESTWRSYCEPLILARISSEVVWYEIVKV